MDAVVESGWDQPRMGGAYPYFQGFQHPSSIPELPRELLQ